MNKYPGFAFDRSDLFVTVNMAKGSIATSRILTLGNRTFLKAIWGLSEEKQNVTFPTDYVTKNWRTSTLIFCVKLCKITIFVC